MKGPGVVRLAGERLCRLEEHAPESVGSVAEVVQGKADVALGDQARLTRPRGEADRVVGLVAEVEAQQQARPHLAGRKTSEQGEDVQPPVQRFQLRADEAQCLLVLAASDGQGIGQSTCCGGLRDQVVGVGVRLDRG